MNVDFVAINAEGITYFQVAAALRDKPSFDRDPESLNKINDQRPKYILKLDEAPNTNFNGIRKINVLE